MKCNKPRNRKSYQNEFKFRRYNYNGDNMKRYSKNIVIDLYLLYTVDVYVSWYDKLYIHTRSHCHCVTLYSVIYFFYIESIFYINTVVFAF